MQQAFYEMRSCIIWLALLVIMGHGALAQSITASQETEKIVQTQGRGTSFEEALSQALMLAIGEVNGVEIQKSTDVTSVVTEYSTSNKVAIDAKSDLSSDAFEVDIAASGRADASRASEATRTKLGGVIKNFKVMKAVNANEGLLSSFSKPNQSPWTVDITAAIKVVKAASYNASTASKRLKVASLPLRVSESLARSDAQALAEQWRKATTNELTQSGRVAVIDREYSGDIFAELAFLQNPQVKKDEAARLGNQLGADYVVVGTLDAASTVKVQQKLKTADRIIEGPPLSSITITYRVIETATGVIEVADSFARKDVQNVSLSSLVDLASRDAVSGILQKLFPLRIERIVDGTVYLGQGGKALKAGMRFDVFSLGNTITDSYTKEVIGREEKAVGTIEISEVLPTMTKARFVPMDGIQPPTAVSEPGSLVARTAAIAVPKSETPVASKKPSAAEVGPLDKPKAGDVEQLKKSIDKDY